jgi:hypothetical protein
LVPVLGITPDQLVTPFDAITLTVASSMSAPLSLRTLTWISSMLRPLSFSPIISTITSLRIGVAVGELVFVGVGV